jgi:hypothetical protein
MLISKVLITLIGCLVLSTIAPTKAQAQWFNNNSGATWQNGQPVFKSDKNRNSRRRPAPRPSRPDVREVPRSLQQDNGLGWFSIPEPPRERRMAPQRQPRLRASPSPITNKFCMITKIPGTDFYEVLRATNNKRGISGRQYVPISGGQRIERQATESRAKSENMTHKSAFKLEAACQAFRDQIISTNCGCSRRNQNSYAQYCSAETEQLRCRNRSTYSGAIPAHQHVRNRAAAR